jgi:hypothetical protein
MRSSLRSGGLETRGTHDHLRRTPIQLPRGCHPSSSLAVGNVKTALTLGSRRSWTHLVVVALFTLPDPAVDLPSQGDTSARAIVSGLKPLALDGLSRARRS